MRDGGFLGDSAVALANAGQFAVLCAAWDLGLLLPESVPAIMQEAMCRGHLDASVIHAAGLVLPTRVENEQEITTAFHALPETPSSGEGALEVLGKYWLQRVAEGTDSQAEDVLDAADGAYAMLDYPGEPFFTLAYFRDMRLWDPGDRPTLEQVLAMARKWAADYLTGKVAERT